MMIMILIMVVIMVPYNDNFKAIIVSEPMHNTEYMY